MSATTTSADPFGIQMLKPTKAGGQVWFMYNTDFNDDPQVYTDSASLEYVVHDVADADGSHFSISASDTFKTYIAPSTGLIPSQCITDQAEMARRGYMQSPQDWRNVEFTGQFVVFTESQDFITFGFRGGKHEGSGAPQGCTACTYLVEIQMTHGGLIRVRKKSWNTSIHNWLSGLASGFDATKPCGWTAKILCYNTQDGKNVTVEVWLDKNNENHFEKVLSGIDTGQLNTDGTICNCPAPGGQPLTWGAPAILMQGTTGKFGFKNMTIREIEGYGATLPPIDPDPGTGGGTGGTGGGTGGGGTGGGTGSGSGSGSGTGGGGEPVDLTPILATPQTQYVQYGGGPQYSPLDIYFIYAGAAWNTAPSSTPGTTSTVTAAPILAAPKSTKFANTDHGMVFSDAVVHFIFWGSGWNTHTTPWSKSSIMAAIDKLFNSSYFDGLIQYGVNRPKIGTIAVNTTYAPVADFELQDLGNLIIDSINHNLVPDKGVPTSIPAGSSTPIPHHIYYVIGAHNFYPSSTSINASSFHSLYNYTADGSLYAYAYTNDMDFVSGNTTNMKYMTYGMGHEIVETLTDPLISAWQNTDPGAGDDESEISDICAAEFVVNTVITAGYWSNQDNACIAPTSKPSWISCASGYTYNATTQLCSKTTTTGGATTGDSTKTANSSLKSSIQSAITTLFSNSGLYFKGLFQYGLTKPPNAKAFVVNSTAATLPNGYTQTQLNTFIDASISSGLVPKNNDTVKNIAYCVILPPGVKTSAGSFGWHYARAQTISGNYDMIVSLAQDQALTDFTKLCSQLLVDMVANNGYTSIPGKGYTIKANTPLDSKVTQYGNELANVCYDDTTNNTFNGITVAKYYSDYDGKCMIPQSSTNPTPFATCHTGAIFDNATMTCKLLPPTGGGGSTPPGSGGQGYKIFEAVASDDDGHVPANAIDGKLDTRWSAFGKGQYLRLDLATDTTPTAKKVNKVKIAWYQGDKRSNHFEIQTAETKGGAYTSQLTKDSDKGSTALQDYAINPANPVRYVRIKVYGNTLNDWASISEVEIWGPDVPSTTPGTGTGGDPGSGGTTPGGDTGGGTQTPAPPTIASYNFFDTSFSIDYHKIGLCNPAE